MKRVIIMILVLTLCMTMAVPAMADEGGGNAVNYVFSQEATGTWKLEFMDPDVTVQLVPDGTVLAADSGAPLFIRPYTLDESGFRDVVFEEHPTELTIEDNGIIYFAAVYDEEKDGAADEGIWVKAGEPDQVNELICGVSDTEIKVKSSVTKKGSIKVSWTKSKGYSLDYYEVFRSLKKSSGYGAKPYYKTSSGKKTSYTNGKVDKGTTYYYRIRGVRTIEGKKYYTSWSNKTWKKAK